MGCGSSSSGRHTATTRTTRRGTSLPTTTQFSVQVVSANDTLLMVFEVEGGGKTVLDAGTLPGSVPAYQRGQEGPQMLVSSLIMGINLREPAAQIVVQTAWDKDMTACRSSIASIGACPQSPGPWRVRINGKVYDYHQVALELVSPEDDIALVASQPT